MPATPHLDKLLARYDAEPQMYFIDFTLNGRTQKEVRIPSRNAREAIAYVKQHYPGATDIKPRGPDSDPNFRRYLVKYTAENREGVTVHYDFSFDTTSKDPRGTALKALRTGGMMKNIKITDLREIKS
jgi:hypothetical protein